MNWATPAIPAQPGGVGIPDAPTATTGPEMANEFKSQRLSSSTKETANTAARDEAVPTESSDSPPESVHQSLVLNTDPVYRLGEDTLLPGGPAVTINNVPYALAPSADALVSGTNTINLEDPTSASPFLAINGQTYTADDASNLIIGSKTIIPGGTPVTVDDVVYSIPLPANILISNGQTTPLVAKSGGPPTLTIAGQIISPEARPRITIDGQELVAGGSTTTIGSIPYALAPLGTALIAGSNTIAIVTQPADVNGEPIPSQALDDKTAFHNGDVTLVIESSTTILSPSADGSMGPVITINSTPYTPNVASAYVIGNQTLAPGSPAITISSTVYSLPDPSPSPASRFSTSLSDPSVGEIVLTVASAAYTCRQDAPCTIASQVLAPNGTITVGADTIVYGERGIDVVRATTTVVGGSSTLSRGEVITSHIDGLVPIGEETEAAAAGPGTGDTEGRGNRVGVNRGNLLSIVLGLILTLLLR
ncbi:MAG: hypothetical protein Q9169_006866 [Polycauliona sp. 2 TL-2023]